MAVTPTDDGPIDMPTVDDVLANPVLARWVDRVGRPRVSDWADQSLQSLAVQAKRGQLKRRDRDSLTEKAAFFAAGLAEADHLHRLRPIINATGVILRRDLGNAPLADLVWPMLREIGRFSNYARDLPTDDPAPVGQQIHGLWQSLTGAEASLLAHHPAFLAQSLLAGLPMGPLVFVPSPHARPEESLSWQTLCASVGRPFVRRELADATTVNGQHTSPEDVPRLLVLEQAPPLSPDLGQRRRQLIEHAHQQGQLVIEHLIDPSLIDLKPWGLIGWPTVSAALADGADAVLFACDRWIGGPPIGVLLGSLTVVEAGLNQFEQADSWWHRAHQPDKLALAALQATLDAHAADQALSDIPALQQLSRDEDDLHQSANELVEGLSALTLPFQLDLDVTRHETPVDDRGHPASQRPSWKVRLRSPHISPGDLARMLRTSQPAVLCGQGDDHLLFDVRTIMPGQDRDLAQAFLTLG